MHNMNILMLDSYSMHQDLSKELSDEMYMSTIEEVGYLTY